MGKLLVIIFILWSVTNSYAQSSDIVSEIISDCEGATNILEPGDYSIQFTGDGGLYDDIVEYASLTDVSEKNSLWLSFIAPFDGFINLQAYLDNGGIQMVVFQNERGDLCEDIHNGSAEIKRLFKDISKSEVGLNKQPKGNQLYSLELTEGEKVAFLFVTNDKSREILHLNFDFEAKNKSSLKVKSKSKIVDFREDDFTPSVHVSVRDVATGLPVISSLVIEGSKTVAGMYVGSDFYYVVERMSNVVIRCNAKGYFFEDKEVRMPANEDLDITFWLEPLSQGKSLQLEEIEFHPGTSEFMPSSYPKLKRLKDFMALNSEVNIEIQGHVFSQKGFSLVGQVLSEARAKRVYNYLVENGIDKHRMSTIGKGSKEPIYPNPKFSYEEQMNRRVEIQIME
jgi:outer membrane protein OmpA-like peptidoglycan-associated protein